MALDLRELFGEQKKPSRNMRLAMLLRVLADVLEQHEDTGEPPEEKSPFEETEVRTRPHFMPLGGG